MMVRLLKSFGHALNGIRLSIVCEMNFKIHLVTMIIVVFAGFFCTLSVMEWVAVIICMAMVLSAELFNTAIEKLCNEIHPDFNLNIKQIKDIAAAAVLVVSLASGCTGLFIFIPKLF